MASITSKRSDQIAREWGRPYGEAKDAPIKSPTKKAVETQHYSPPRKSRLTLFNDQV